MALTEAEKTELKKDILNAIKAESQSVDELETVSTLDNVNSLPAMKGTEVVKVPISLLAKPATDAAAKANEAAENAQQKATLASASAASAATAAQSANESAGNADDAATAAFEAASNVADKVEASMQGQSARFYSIVESATILMASSTATGGSIVYVRNAKKFAYLVGGSYYSNWNVANVAVAEMYMDGSRTNILKNKTYLLDDAVYVWSEEDNDLVEISGSGGGGFYNLTTEQPLTSGYYTKAKAVAAMTDSDIDDEQKQGMIITFEVSAGKWEDYRFVGTSLATFTEVSAWERFGGGDAIKKLHITKGTKIEDLTPDAEGVLNLDIPIVETDQTIEENSTNPVAGKAVAAMFKEVAGKYGAALKLNETGDGDNKAYSLSLLDETGEVLSTSDQFTGGGGGSVATTKVTLTRLTANPTVKNGDAVKLSYKYDQTDTTSGESTGNSGKTVITITHGANSTTIESTIAAGSTQDIDVSNYIGVGTNTVRVRVTAGEGDEAQVSTISWTVTVVQLTLTSSFNIATVINRGDTVSIPYALSGSGTKTLRCYIDGVDAEDRTITASSANGSFSINTLSMVHGSHTVQMVAELELAGGSVIKSNSIYYAIGVRESGSKAPIIATRFDFNDGTIIEGNNTPYIDVKQYDNYTLRYAVYNPAETPTTVSVYEAGTLLSSAKLAFTTTQLTQRAMNYGTETCQIKCGTTTYTYRMLISKSDLSISEPTDNMALKLSASGRTNDDTNKTEWSYNGIQTMFEGFKWGGDGWLNNALRHTDDAHSTVKYQPLRQPDQNVNNAMAFVVKFKVSEVTDEDAELIKCVDENGTGFIITSNEARMVTRGNSKLSMKMAAGETYEVGFVSFPKAGGGASDYEITNSEMVYLYINGIMSGSVQRGTSDSIYQSTPQYIEMGAPGATLDVYLMRSYTTYLTDTQMLDCHIIDQDGVNALMELYEENNVLDENGNMSVDSVPDDMRYIIITGKQANGVATVMQAAVTNNKKTKFDVDEILCVKRSDPRLNFHLIGGCISLQGTSSLAYPIKNYRFYTYSSNKTPGELYLGCNSQGVGGTLDEGGAYSFRLAGGTQRKAAPVKCFCLKADYAESSSSHNTGMARLAQEVLTAADELTPVQKHVDTSQYEYEVRTTIDGEPCLLFYRATVDDTPTLLGKFNFNNDKSTEAVFGFLDIPGYHDADWVSSKFGGKNPTQCWEFLNNDYAMGMFLDDDFESSTDGEPNWQKVFEGRFPDGGTDTTYLQPLVSWVKSTNRREAGISDDVKTARATKFKAELGNYFDVDYLCDYYVLTEVFGCVDQRVKNMMMAFFYNPDKAKMLAYMIFYDCDTILGVRNDGRLKYSWDVNEETIDTELSTNEKTVYAYAGHDSVLWANLRELLSDKIGEAYKRLRAKMSNDTVFQMFDNEQSAKYCARIYNIDAMNKYVTPKTKGVEVTVDGSVTNVKHSYLEAMQGNRQAHRHWWLTNRFGLLDARYSTGQYTQTDISWKGNSAAGAVVKATAKREFYFEFRREGDTMIHSAVGEGEEFSYTYDQVANVGTIFHLLGGQWMSALDLSGWGGFTDVSLPQLPILETLIMGKTGSTYTLTELVIGTKLPMLRKIDLRNYTKLPGLDLSGCTRLEEVNAGGCSTLATMSFAEGVPLSKLILPDNYQTLTLRSLPQLTRRNITFGNSRNITGLWVENCEQLDGFALFQELFAMGGLKYVRLTGLEMQGDGSDLKKWYDAGLGGIDTEGNTVGKCKLCGNYQLTTYLSEAEYQKYVELFDELNIRQPQYTMIEFDDTVSDDANVSNLDNKTGYKYSKGYAMSGHLTKIYGKRHRVLAKQATKGTMTICQLHDENSNYYADAEIATAATPAKLDGTEGDAMMFEPYYWFKGINDFLNNKKYSCYSSNTEMPDIPEATVISYDDILAAGNVRASYKILSGKTDLQSSYTADSVYSVCKVHVDGFKKVRFPTVPGTGLIASAFTDDAGNIIDTMVVSTIIGKFEPGMYLIADVPVGATWINFTIQKTAEFDCVVLSNSERIEDMEPDWVEHDECLVGLFETTIVGTKFRSVVSGGASTGSMTWTDFNYYSAARNMQQIDYEMHRDIANLFFARYGRRDSQTQCGAGSHTSARTTGGTVARGMTETIGYDEAYTINPNITKELVDNINPQYAWYKETDEYGGVTVKQVNNTCCLGYEDIYGDKYEMMDNVNVNVGTVDYKWVISMPNGSKRKVKGASSGQWIQGVVHGKYMDIIPAGNMSGSNSTYYCDRLEMSGSTSRVVYRGYNYAYSYGGVSMSNASYDASNSVAYVGSRLAFRGKIVWATSVSAFKALSEVA